MRRRASFSRDGRYRYTLTREWGDGPRLTWLMLNPSTADGRSDDPTIRRCIGFARLWGYGSTEVVNLFALRATDPHVLARHEAPVGPGNDRAVRRALGRADTVVAAWGNIPPRLRGRGAAARRVASRAACLGLTRAGEPAHPLYLAAATPLRLLPR